MIVAFLHTYGSPWEACCGGDDVTEMIAEGPGYTTSNKRGPSVAKGMEAAHV